MNFKQPPPDPDLSDVQGDNYWVDEYAPIIVMVILLVILVAGMFSLR